MNIDYMQLEYIDIKLRMVINRLQVETGIDFTITSQFRIDDPGTHGTLPLRAHDLRVRHKELGELLAKIVNEIFVYDPDRPEMVVADPHGDGSNYHLHLQVHPNTVRR